MRRFTAISISILLGLTFLACGKAEKAIDQAGISEELKDKGTLELLQESADDQYEPPANGRLNEKQVQMYLKVRDREKQIAQVARKEAEAHAKKAEQKGEKSLAGMVAGFKTLASGMDMFTADIRAAKELGFNTAEYQWVKEKVLEASGVEVSQQMSQSFTAIVDAQIQALEKQLAETSDDTAKPMLQQALDGARQSRAEIASQQEQADPSIAYNRELLSKYEGALDALAHELSKWEENEGDAQRAVTEFQKGVAKAARESGASQ